MSSSKRTTYKSSCAKNVVWSKAEKINGKNPNVYRKDPYGNELYYGSYGKYSEKGWQIDHIKPKNLGGSDDIKNLQALHSSTNASLSDSNIKHNRHE